VSNTRREFTIHLPIRASNTEAAALITRTIGHMLAVFRSVDTRDITLTEPDHPELIHRVFCGRTLTGGRRCVLRADHTGACNHRTAR
jgi:hypothetical protein